MADLGETLDSLRKERIESHPALTMTGLYNVVERLRALRRDPTEPPLSTVERAIHDAGLASRILELHDQIDAATAEAYGWPTDLLAEDMFKRLVDLNAARAAQEAEGDIKWLRPEYQAVHTTVTAEEDVEMNLEVDAGEERPEFPGNGIERAGAIMAVLANADRGLSLEELASRFTQGMRARQPIISILLSLERTGAISRSDGRYYLRRVA